jgi:hypothetical protein
MFNEDWYNDIQCSHLIQLFKTLPPMEASIIEIGCWEGKSTFNLANACYPENLICNDTWMGNINESIITGKKHITCSILENRNVFNSFVNNMNSLTRGNYQIVKKDCIEWLKEFNRPIKFIHIDASHDYESVAQTIRLAIPNMVSGGIMCGDDFLNANISREDLHGGVQRAVTELLPQYRNIDNLWFWYKP